ncbi:riboflavin kinase [Cephus cinctus]|uniref:Riboflavin kinase n=1 Tax=Cephus cinctus TaxID=211228 RepID=A0AAJ7BFP3_CEPCN|nr:riboflavin kinase [Cephus cinctus]
MFGPGLPHFAVGQIVKGFGRGSKDLGIPTANYPLEVVKSLPNEIATGIYYGWASVDRGNVYKMVMSIGWNPFYKNVHKSMETHIMHKYDRDLYGSELRVAVLAYLRPEKDFASLEDMIKEIKNDIEIAEESLDRPEYAAYRTHYFFCQENSSD